MVCREDKQCHRCPILGLALQQQILYFHFPLQMPAHFKIVPLPSAFNFWLISTLQRLPVNAWLQEQHTTMGLDPGEDGRHIVNPSDATIFAWIDLPGRSKSSCLGHSPWLSYQEDFWGRNTQLWLKAQSEVPYYMWYRPSRRRADQTLPKM